MKFITFLSLFVAFTLSAFTHRAEAETNLSYDCESKEVHQLPFGQKVPVFTVLADRRGDEVNFVLEYIFDLPKAVRGRAVEDTRFESLNSKLQFEVSSNRSANRLEAKVTFADRKIDLLCKTGLEYSTEWEQLLE